MNKQPFTAIVNILVFIVLLSLAASTFSCGKSDAKPDKYSFYESVVDTSKPIAWGEDRDIYILCDEVNWKSIGENLKNNLEQEFQIVVKERYFNIKRGDIRDINQLIKYKNLLFVGNLDSKASVSAHITRTLPPQLVNKVKNTGIEMFVAKNRWVTDQVIVYLVTSSQDKISSISEPITDKLFSLYLERLAERKAYQAYRTKLIPDTFYETYPFTIKMPENYKLFANSPKNRFLSFLYRMNSESKDFPDKYLSIYYEDIPQDSLNEKWILQKRKILADKYYDKDEFDPGMISIDKVSIGTYTAWRLMGPWKNLKHNIGGGFQTFAFYDIKQKRAYLIDNVVYFPAGDKLPELLELQQISQTFKTK